MKETSRNRRTRDDAMPMPSGIHPTPPPIERCTGIPVRALAIMAGDQTPPSPSGWSEGGFMMGNAHPVTNQMVGVTEGLTLTEAQRKQIVAADAQRCSDALRAINRQNREKWQQ